MYFPVISLRVRQGRDVALKVDFTANSGLAGPALQLHEWADVARVARLVRGRPFGVALASTKGGSEGRYHRHNEGTQRWSGGAENGEVDFERRPDGCWTSVP